MTKEYECRDCEYVSDEYELLDPDQPECPECGSADVEEIG